AFAEAAKDCPYRIGLAVPQKLDDQSAPTVRDVINLINVGAFGALVQNADFEFEYKILQPDRPTSSMTLLEKDLLTWTVDSLSKDVSSSVTLSYAPKEHDPSIG